jgi:Condensation domain
VSEISRPLSAVERWYWVSDQYSPLNVISRVQIHGALSVDALRRGLDALQARHPLLRTAIHHEGGREPRWVPTTRAIPLRRVERTDEEHWLREINQVELVERVEPALGPLIRVTLLAGRDGVHDLLIVVPHIIADGTTVLSLAQQLLTLALESDAALPPLRTRPPTEELRPAPFTGSEGQARLAEQNERDQQILAAHRPGRVEASAMVPLERRRTQLRHRELGAEQLDVVARLAKAHGTTVHGAVTAALVLAAARDAGRSAGSFAIGSPIDFRGELSPPVQPDEVGTYVATVPSIVDIGLPFWDLARAITSDLAERKARGYHFNLVTLVVGAAPTSVADARPFLQFMEAEGPINLCSSNIGRYAFPERIGACRLSDAQFLTGISVNGYFVATINTSHGRLFWNFTFIDEVIPAERAERIIASCVTSLLMAIAEPAPSNS